MYKVFRSEQYQQIFEKLDYSEQKRVLQCERNIQREPRVAKPLGYPFLREKKLNGKRLLFLLYEDKEQILLVTICTKKTQRMEINIIKAQLYWYEGEIEKMSKEFV